MVQLTTNIYTVINENEREITNKIIEIGFPEKHLGILQKDIRSLALAFSLCKPICKIVHDPYYMDTCIRGTALLLINNMLLQRDTKEYLYKRNQFMEWIDNLIKSNSNYDNYPIF